ncbi:MAG: hypothetical protein KGQ46_12340 [Hyphomicrobiales bacterium]|nr:hypothetical protein [Hyphomicrobiales bacterium]MDE2113851.1 hypothetical protein [Hyphomicrobiales bacterium]
MKAFLMILIGLAMVYAFITQPQTGWLFIGLGAVMGVVSTLGGRRK